MEVLSMRATTTSTNPAPWDTVDPALINYRAVRLVEAFKESLARMRDEHGLTFDDLNTVATLLQQLHDATGAPLSLCAMPLFSEVFQGGGNGYTISEDVESPTFIPDSPLIDNPGTLPMRPDEPGTPLIASGRVLDGHGHPLAGAELTIYHASNDGIYSGIWDENQPKFNLRSRQITDDEGRYTFTTITPVPYSNTPSQAVDTVAKAAAALGRSLYRPAHIHYEIHHPDLLTPYRGEVYFTGDPVIPIDFVGPKIAGPSLQADTVRHNDPDDIAAHGFSRPFNTAAFDFILKTRTSPDKAARPEPAA
jgi:catechol 1,2-dioxygenase